MHPEPVATYRLQLRPGFGFDRAAEVVDYLSEIGISHLYTSPYLQAAAGSTHGYDVVDPGRVNEELGGAQAHARMCRRLTSAGLGHLIDIVPNHMAIAGRQNPWWWDVLENGPSSHYAAYFDVDWESSGERWPDKVLLPVLADHYGRILEDGQFRLSYEDESFILHYQEHIFPVDPSSLVDLLSRAAASCGSDLLAFIAESHARLPRPTVTARQEIKRRHRDKAVLAGLLAKLYRREPGARAAIDTEIEQINRNPDVMDALIDQQNYRPAFWRTASRDLGYRRFFDIKDLVGLRVEDPEVFLASHALPVGWVKKGWVHGLRIDHPDGLRDPAQYFARLREFCPDIWIVAEKILEPGERLPAQWPIAGTTGYEFLNLAGGLFIDPNGEDYLTRTYKEFTGEGSDWQELVHACKRHVLTELLGSELTRLTSLFVAICEKHRRHRDYTRHELYEALLETAVCFPVYRSYVSARKNAVSPQDEEHIARATESAEARQAELDPELFRFLKDLLELQVTGTLENELAMRFQQLTGPAMAKGVEDTAMYRFHRLTALNEVGGDPSRFGVYLEQFHENCAAAQGERPLALLASTTHDTKRSEDVRARLAVLSEIPERWGDAVIKWSKNNEQYRRGDIPERNTEYLFYQTLVGAWPIDEQRMAAYMEKAVREAKINTSWIMQDQDYERGLEGFIKAVLKDESFCAQIQGFVADILTPGRINSLAQTLIKLTAPGVPDIYQGCELWDLSLVDPDNRRVVDFTLRRRLLGELEGLCPEDIMAGMDQGLPKLWVILQALHLRRSRPELFGPQGSYRALYARGMKAGHAVAFVRGEGAVCVVPRLVISLDGDWADTQLELPPGHWRNVLTGEDAAGGPILLSEILGRFPVGLFEKRR